MKLKLEVVVLPVSDVDVSREFYEALGFRLDADFPVSEKNFRVVQLTPPGSECSIIFGDGVTVAQASASPRSSTTPTACSTTRARKTGSPARTRSAPTTAPSPHSATRTATAGYSRR
ncbi:hypothetical protein LWC34_16605 [Kibdelosporangium philippinense]|uniref:Glyoxalase-like domain-containing protein n=1 Tax=Kibdelosporangium philippinense TaxID=211113 RepID=A0ABS8ZD49_9PSEU|nr:hypothetical protein [Kibdelosporangium philippinense]MCE7004443.1 hypothetical protein [Kibdelosporangium philippinense]